VVQTARLGSHNTGMKFFALLLLISVCAFGAENKRASDVRPPKASSLTVTNDPVELEYEKLLAQDDMAQKEVDQWVKDAQAFADKGVPINQATLSLKAEARFKEVKDAYEKFLAEHPKHAEARLAYGSFLMDIHEEEEAVVQMEKSREIDPKNPAAWNNLANHYGHRGPVLRAFPYYEKAIDLDPKEPVYKQNLATTIYLFRKDAQQVYSINEQQVFDRALDLYQQAMKLDPTNLVMAVDYAQTYYGIRPMRTNEALAAWKHALTLCKNTDEEQGILLHLARVELNTGRWDESLVHLSGVTNTVMMDVKKRLERNWIEKRNKALGITNSAEALASALPAKIN
jgi:tetratricopeptide (TPR) repeat protein